MGNNVENRRIDTSDVAVVIVGSQKRVSYANAAAHRLLAQPLGSIQGRPFKDLLVDESKCDLSGLERAFHAASGQGARGLIRCGEIHRDMRLAFEPFAAPDGAIVAVSVALEPLTPLTPVAPVERPTLPEIRPEPRKEPWNEPGSGARKIAAPLPISQTIAEVAPVEPAKAEQPVTLNKDLQTLANLLRWADHCLSSPLDAAGDLEGVRARARFVLEEARDLLARCRLQIDTL